MAAKKPKKSNRSLTTMETSHFDINARFKLIRLEKKLTQKEFAELSGLSLSYIKGIEGYHFSASVSAIKEVHKAFGVSYDWLIDGSKP